MSDSDSILFQKTFFHHLSQSAISHAKVNNWALNSYLLTSA